LPGDEKEQGEKDCVVYRVIAGHACILSPEAAASDRRLKLRETPGTDSGIMRRPDEEGK
jgi:hypothetical protein